MPQNNPFEVIADIEFDQAVTHQKLLSLFTEARNFSRANFSDVSIENIEAKSLCFTYCIFSGCNFGHLDFSKMDLEGCTFIRCNFNDISFERCDVKTCKFIDCSFERASFNGALFQRNQFSQSSLKSVNFSNTVHIENTFFACELVDCLTTQMTASLNEYDQCNFSSFSFTVGTYAYQILWQCNFENCVIGWATLGITYGLTRENLKHFRLVHYFSEISEATPDEVLQFIIEQFQASSNIYRALIVSANFGKKRFKSLSSLLNTIIAASRNKKLPIRHEEMLFFRLILKYENKYRAIPLLVLDSFSFLIGGHLEDEWTDFHYLHSYLGHLIQSTSHAIKTDSRSLISDREKLISVRVVYSEKPKLLLKELLSQSVSSGIIETKWEKYSTHQGSFIEVFAATVSFLVSLNIVLGLINYNLKATRSIVQNLKDLRTEFRETVGINSVVPTIPEYKLTSTDINFPSSKILLDQLQKKTDIGEVCDDLSGKIEKIEIEET
ncbi:MAG: pentapeptide repeat-containing protein [Rhodospirillales bacterium]|nr:pentapeptide repeat-containing protein [Rhodospirillales bacterium]